MPSTRRQTLQAIVATTPIPISGCFLEAARDWQKGEPSLKLEVENRDTESHLVDAYIQADNIAFDDIDAVHLSPDSSFTFAGARYRRDAYTIGVVTRETSLTYEWKPQKCGEHLSLDVYIGTDGQLHKDAECVG